MLIALLIPKQHAKFASIMPSSPILLKISVDEKSLNVDVSAYSTKMCTNIVLLLNVLLLGLISSEPSSSALNVKRLTS